MACIKPALTSCRCCRRTVGGRLSRRGMPSYNAYRAFLPSMYLPPLLQPCTLHISAVAPASSRYLIICLLCLGRADAWRRAWTLLLCDSAISATPVDVLDMAGISLALSCPDLSFILSFWVFSPPAVASHLLLSGRGGRGLLLI